MKASVAYEGKSQKPKVKPLKWHIGHRGRNDAHRHLVAKGVKGEYRIERQKPNRRLGVFKWCLWLNDKPVTLDKAPYESASSPIDRKVSDDDLAELKAFASSYDAMPPTEIDVAVVVVEPAVGERRASESPTREEWEVVVHHAPAAHRGAILNMAGPGDSFEVGNKIILQGFHDDTVASNVAASIVKRYHVPVTTGPIRKTPSDANEAPRRRTDEERRYPLKWTDTPKGNSFAHGTQGSYYVTRAETRADSWDLTGPNAVRLGSFRSKQEAEDEAERAEFLERRNTRMRREYSDDDDGGRLTAHDSHPAGQAANCGCEPFTVVSKDPAKFKICTERANRIGKLNTPRRIYDFMAPDVVNKPYEEFYVLGIGAHGEFEGKLITYARVAQGGQHKVNVETEEIARILLADRPDIWVVAHNHPSNNAEPSDGDIELTKTLKESLKKSCPGIVFGDHVILAANSFYSFRAGKLFKV